MTNTVNITEDKLDFKDLSSLVGDKTKIILHSSKNVISDLETFQERPNAIREEKQFSDLRGFLDYSNDFKRPESVCFASDSALTVHFDYHTPTEPSHVQHTGKYTLRPSSRWKLWKDGNDKWFTQENFCDFLDSGLNEIVTPPQSDVLDLTKNFRATVNYELSTKDGGNDFTFTKKTSGGNSKAVDLKLPEHLEIVVAPFKGLEVINKRVTEQKLPAFTAFKLKAKLSWKVSLDTRTDEQKLFFKYKLLNSEQLEDTTLEDLRTAVQTLTGIKTYIS